MTYTHTYIYVYVYIHAQGRQEYEDEPHDLLSRVKRAIGFAPEKPTHEATTATTVCVCIYMRMYVCGARARKACT